MKNLLYNLGVSSVKTQEASSFLADGHEASLKTEKKNTKTVTIIEIRTKKKKKRLGMVILNTPGLLCMGVTSSIFSGPRNAVCGASDSRAKGLGFDTRSGHIISFLLPLIQEDQLSVTGEYLHKGGLALLRKNVVSLTDRRDTTSAVNCGRKTKTQQQQSLRLCCG